MKKIFLIGWKDLRLAFRDRAALILMLAAPYLLTVAMGFVTGRFSGSSSAISEIDVLLVNQDSGSLGGALVDVFQSSELDDLLNPQVLDDPAQARQQVDDDLVAAAVIVPAGFSASMIPAQEGADSGTPESSVVPLEIYTNPNRPTSAGVVRAIAAEFINRVEIGRVGGQVTVTQLIESGRIDPQDAAAVGAQIGQQQAGETPQNSIVLNSVTSDGELVEFDPLALLAPGMALMFLMFTVSYGGRTLLAERAQGTLPRLLVSPTTTAQVLGGKIFGIFLTGVAQMLILILASTLMFQVRWGSPLGVLALVLAAVVAAVGWGMLITALAKTPAQVANVGSAVMLVFGILGGSFLDISNMPGWYQALSRITPNAWGIDGFVALSMGSSLADIANILLALLLMGALLFAAAVLLFNRRGLDRG